MFPATFDTGTESVKRTCWNKLNVMANDH